MTTLLRSVPIEAAGLLIERTKDNPYEFISERARNASAQYGVKSIALLAAQGSRPRQIHPARRTA